MAATTYTPTARIMKALALADLLDAADIGSDSAETMDLPAWILLARAARVRAPSPRTRALVLTLLQLRAAARHQLQQEPRR